MARASTTIVRRIVWDNLGISLQSSGYGNLDTTNQRYLSGYIDDNIVKADVATIMLLLKHKQNILLKDISTDSSSLASGATIPNNWAIIEVTINSEKAKEITYGQYEQLALGGIYDTSTYTGYYAIKDSKIYYIGASTSCVISYVDLTHPTTLSSLLSPTGFEGALADLASAFLLMKRSDKPEQSKFYYTNYTNFMQGFMTPDTNVQEIISD